MYIYIYIYISMLGARGLRRGRVPPSSLSAYFGHTSSCADFRRSSVPPWSRRPARTNEILGKPKEDLSNPKPGHIRDGREFGRGDDTVGNPHRAQISRFGLFELKFLNSSFRACPPIEIKQTILCRAIRADSISVISTLPPLKVPPSGVEPPNKRCTTHRDFTKEAPLLC